MLNIPFSHNQIIRVRFHNTRVDLPIFNHITERPGKQATRLKPYNPFLSISTARSTRRFEKPHSLSYHDRIHHIPPITSVESPSMMDERGSP